MQNDGPLAIGIEEEYLLVDLETRALAADPPDSFMRACRDVLGERVTPEFLRCQIEVGTSVCENVLEARRQLARFRRVIAEEARRHGLGLMAAASHPFLRLEHAGHHRQGALHEARG